MAKFNNEGFVIELEKNEILIFGSNLNGWHAGGAARQAKEKFGAIEGSSNGPQGQSYAIPTLGYEMEKLPLEEIKYHLQALLDYAELNPDLEFLLTPIGTGIANFSLQEIKSILPDFPSNVILVGNWE